MHGTGIKTLYISVHVQNTGVVLCRRSRVAATFFTRMLGLLGKRRFKDSDGMLLRPSNAIHTLGMTFPIDAIALDRHGRVVGLRSDLQPLRAAYFGVHSHEVLELPSGRIQRAGIRVGDRLTFADSAISSPR